MEKRERYLLIIDSDAELRKEIADILTLQKYTVISAGTGQEGMDLFGRYPFCFLILGWSLPDTSGEVLCMLIRKNSTVPIMVLGSGGGEEEVLRALSVGADVHLARPVGLRTLSAYVESVRRRVAGNEIPASYFSWNDGDLIVDLGIRRVYKSGVPVELTPSEWRLLTALVRRQKKIFSREELIESVFHEDFDGYDRAIDTHIKNLRKKIEDDTRKPLYIQTVRGVGYRFGGDRPAGPMV